MRFHHVVPLAPLAQRFALRWRRRKRKLIREELQDLFRFIEERSVGGAAAGQPLEPAELMLNVDDILLCMLRVPKNGDTTKCGVAAYNLNNFVMLYEDAKGRRNKFGHTCFAGERS